MLFLEPLNPSDPALDQLMAFPVVSVIVTIVLLNVERICAIPDSTFFRSRLLVRVVVADLRLPFVVAKSYPPYFFLPATVRRGPLRVRALVLVRCPRTGRPLR